MIYNKDVAHCTGYLCDKKDKCYRFWLFKEWNDNLIGGTVSIIPSKYNQKTKRCKMFKRMC